MSTEVGRFVYGSTEFVVTVEPSRKTGRPTYHSRPADGGYFPATIDPVNYCKAFRRWRVKFDKQRRQGLQ